MKATIVTSQDKKVTTLEEKYHMASDLLRMDISAAAVKDCKKAVSMDCGVMLRDLERTRKSVKVKCGTRVIRMWHGSL